MRSWSAVLGGCAGSRASAVRAGAASTAMLLLARDAGASPAVPPLQPGEAAQSAQPAEEAEEAAQTQSLLLLALPFPALLDDLVRARCAAIAGAEAPAVAAAQLRAELALPPVTARVLTRLQEGATRCDDEPAT